MNLRDSSLARGARRCVLSPPLGGGSSRPPCSSQLRPLAITIQAPVSNSPPQHSDTSAAIQQQQRSHTGHSASTSLPSKQQSNGQSPSTTSHNLVWTRWHWPCFLHGEEIELWGACLGWGCVGAAPLPLCSLSHSLPHTRTSTVGLHPCFSKRAHQMAFCHMVPPGSFNAWKKGVKLLRFSPGDDAAVLLALKPGNYQVR